MSEATVIRRIAAVDCAFEPRPWLFAAENRTAIDAHWKAISEGKPAMFNGQVLLMHRWSVEDDVFRGAYFETDYAGFIAFRDFGYPDPTTRNGFSMAALQAADGAFLLGEMGAHTANAGAIYFAAGTPDLKDVVGDRVDLARSVTRELAEETGLDPLDLVAEMGWTMVAETGRIALIRRMTSALDSGALLRKITEFLASETEPELERMHVVRTLADIPEDRMPPFQQAYLRWVLSGAPR